MYQLEYNMKIGSASLFGRLCCGLSMAALALVVSLNDVRSVRADDFDDLAASLQELIVDPVMNTLHRLDERLTGAEEKPVADQEPENTGTVASALSAPAIVSFPELPIIVESAVPSEE